MCAETNILLIEDNKTDAFVINHRIHGVFPEFKVTTVHRVREAYETLRKMHFDLIISDLNLPDSMGPRTIQDIRLLDKKTPIVALTGFKTALTEEEAIKLGADEVVSKLKVSDAIFIETLQKHLGLLQDDDEDVVYIEQGGADG